MNRITISLVVVINCLFITSCSTHLNEESILKIDLTQKIESKVINLEDLGTDFTMSLFKTPDSILLSPFANYYFCDDAIYWYNFNTRQFFEFDNNGNYKGVCVEIGEGPDKISQLHHYYIDTKSHILYNAYKGNMIDRYNLKERKFLDPIPFEFCNDISIMRSYNDTTLLIKIGEINTIGCELVLLSNKGNILNRIGKKEVKSLKPGESHGSGGYYMKKLTSGAWIFSDGGNDTLYTLEDKLIKPYIIIDQPEPIKDGSKTISKTSYVQDETENLIFIFQTEMIKKTTEGGGVSMSFGENRQILYDKNNQQSYSVSSTLYLQEALNLEHFDVGYSNGKISVILGAEQLKENLQELLNDVNISSEHRKSLEELNNTFTSESNPILLKGNLK
jgi:hypothetical protein